MHYAADAPRSRGMAAAPGMPEVEILGEQIDLAQPAHIELTAEWPSEYKAAAAIRSKLGLSRTAFDRLCGEGKIVCVSGHNLKKCKLSGTIVIEIR